MKYAVDKKVRSDNPADGIDLPQKMEKKPYQKHWHTENSGYGTDIDSAGYQQAGTRQFICRCCFMYWRATQKRLLQRMSMGIIGDYRWLCGWNSAIHWWGSANLGYRFWDWDRSYRDDYLYKIEHTRKKSIAEKRTNVLKYGYTFLSIRAIICLTGKKASMARGSICFSLARQRRIEGSEHARIKEVNSGMSDDL